MITTAAKTFTDERVPVDGVQFVDCDFVRATLVLHGYGAPGFDGCTFTDCRWEFTGPAGVALGFLRACAADPATRPMIAATFPEIACPDRPAGQ